MTDPKTEAHVTAMTETLGLTIAPEWQAGVYRFFETARDMAAIVAKTDAAETSEPAPVFTPGNFDALTSKAEPTR